MLEKISYWDHDRGIRVECYTDGYAFDEYNFLHLISLVGPDSAVKAISSALVNHREMDVGERCLRTGYYMKYRILSAKLECGALHQIVAAESFLEPDEYKVKPVFIHKDQDETRAILKVIKNHHPVTVIPEWSRWLLMRLTEEGHLSKLSGNLGVYQLNVHEETLDNLISEGIKAGEIAF